MLGKYNTLFLFLLTMCLTGCAGPNPTSFLDLDWFFNPSEPGTGKVYLDGAEVGSHTFETTSDPTNPIADYHAILSDQPVEPGTHTIKVTWKSAVSGSGETVLHEESYDFVVNETVTISNQP